MVTGSNGDRVRRRGVLAMSGELVRQLKELTDLHDSGAITDEEFAAAKARLLGEGTPAPSAASSPQPAPYADEHAESVSPPASPRPDLVSELIPRSGVLRIGSWSLPVRSLLFITGGVIALMLLIAFVALTTQPTDPRSMAVGTWSCRDNDDGPGPARDYIVGDGTYEIPQEGRRGTWSLNGTIVTINETTSYGEDVVPGTATVNLTSPTEPTGGQVEVRSANNEFGIGDQATGFVQYDNETVTVHLQHDSLFNTDADNVTCTRK
jgi:hypothetical protein